MGGAERDMELDTRPARLIERRVLLITLAAFIILPPALGKVDFSLSPLSISAPGLSSPCCIAYLGGGRWVATDTGNDRVVILGSSLEVEKCLEGIFNHPRGVAVGPEGRIWVCDSGNNRVVVLSADLEFQFAFGRSGTAEGQFDLPWGIAVRPDGVVAVSDTLNRRIQIFNLSGTFLQAIGRWGTQPGMFDGPLDLAFDQEGRLFVVDSYMEAEGYVRRVQIFNPDFSFNRTIWDIESRLRFQRPVGIGISPGGTIAVADFFAHRVYLFDAAGEHMGGFSSIPGQPRLLMPFDVAFSDGSSGSEMMAVLEKEPARVRVLDFSIPELYSSLPAVILALSGLLVGSKLDALAKIFTFPPAGTCRGPDAEEDSSRRGKP